MQQHSSGALCYALRRRLRAFAVSHVNCVCVNFDYVDTPTKGLMCHFLGKVAFSNPIVDAVHVRAGLVTKRCW